MSSKNYIAYKHVFEKITYLLSDNNIENNFKNQSFTTEYEKVLRKTLEETIKPKILKGCYFHFAKSLWKKWRDYGLSKKNLGKINRISNTNYERRTNNICESFHRTLNNQISHNHPKISYLVEKLKFYCYEGYKKYNNSLVNNVNLNKSDNNNIAKDVYNFIKSFHSKYNNRIDIIKLIENLKYEQSVNDICKILPNLIFTDGDTFINNLDKAENLCNETENSIENSEKENSNENNENDGFLNEKNNLIEKLENINFEQEENEDIINKDIFEEVETLNEYNSVNYKKLKNKKNVFYI